MHKARSKRSGSSHACAPQVRLCRGKLSNKDARYWSSPAERELPTLLLKGAQDIEKGGEESADAAFDTGPLLIASAAAGVSAQSSPSLRQQLMGTSTFVLAEIRAADGTKSLPFGDTPRGS